MEINLVELPLEEKNNPYLKDMQIIYEDGFPEGKRVPWECILYEFEIARIREKLKRRPNEKFHVIGAIQNEKILGFSVSKFFREFTYAPYLAVSKNFRNKGIGMLIVKKIVEIAKRDARTFKILNSELLFETDKIAITEAEQIKIEKKINFYRKIRFILLDVEFLQPPLIGAAIPKYLWLGPLSDKDYIEAELLLHYVKLIYQLEYSLSEERRPEEFERYMKAFSESIKGRKKIYGI